MSFPRRSIRIRLRRTIHRVLDPILSQRSRIQHNDALRALPDGVYLHPANVPYVSQFTSPDLINDYIHKGLHGHDDPNWASFGAPDPDQYTFWAHRACAIACVKMAVDTFGSALPQTLWELTQAGIALGGYIVRDAEGNFVDRGWMVPAVEELAKSQGLQVRGMAYASLMEIAAQVYAGWLVAATVTPELGERGRLRQYDGHFVLVYGFTLKQGRLTALHIHNPSGREATLQAHAIIHAGRFGRAFAHRYIAFKMPPH